MARVIDWQVQSDLSGAEILKGDRCVVRFEFDADGTRNFTADLTAEEAKALIEHCHAREVTPRKRKNGDSPAEVAAEEKPEKAK